MSMNNVTLDKILLPCKIGFQLPVYAPAHLITMESNNILLQNLKISIHIYQQVRQ
jgi:hypothetical protein